MEDLGWVVGAVLLVEDACRDEDAIAEKVAKEMDSEKRAFHWDGQREGMDV